jgi:hypothetical protein
LAHRKIAAGKSLPSPALPSPLTAGAGHGDEEIDLIRYLFEKGEISSVPLLQSEYFSTDSNETLPSSSSSSSPLPLLQSHRELNSQCLSLITSLTRLVEIRNHLSESEEVGAMVVSKRRVTEVEEYVASLKPELNRLQREVELMKRRQDELIRKIAMVKMSLFGEQKGNVEGEEDDILEIFRFLREMNACAALTSLAPQRR